MKVWFTEHVDLSKSAQLCGSLALRLPAWEFLWQPARQGELVLVLLSQHSVIVKNRGFGTRDVSGNLLCF